MSNVIIKQLSEEEIKQKQIKLWPIWEKEISEFSWEYKATESCLIIEGEVIVTTEDGETLEIKAGDFVIFPKGLKCNWKVLKYIRKYYQFT